MKNITKYALMALLIISANKINAQSSQENDSIISVELDEVVVSTPFKESVKNNVLNVKKLNLNNLNYIKRLNFSDAIQEIPSSALQGIDEVTVGMQLQSQDQDGNPFVVSVIKIEDDKITVDANHPLAGETLHFSVSIEEVREAQEEELSHGHVHAPGGHSH